MSKVTYSIGAIEYSFNTDLQLKDISLLAVEENLHEEVKTDARKKKQQIFGLHDISIIDDNGIIACAKDFKEIGNLTIVKYEK